MFSFSSFIDLPLVFGIIIAIAIFMYVLLDGFDLGIGIIFPFAPTNKCRDQMMNSIAPFWDGNETWLVMGGGGLFAAFPLAYSILLPAFYIPIIAMLIGLIMRGVAFEFRFKASEETKKFWDYIFHFGSLIATFFQGVILGSFVSGINVDGRDFVGLPFDWATSFSIMTGIALVFGYSLLGSTWLIMKTENITQDWSRKVASYVLIFVAIFMILVSAIMPFLNDRIFEFWFSEPNIYYLSILPICTAILFLILWHDLKKSKREYRPFLVSIGLFLTGYIGIAISIYPYIIPYKYDIWQASSSSESLSLLLVGVSFLLPIILSYTAYCYFIFRGKASEKNLY
jgi:cytochrome d ubiquinol oxidase subunit II